MAEGLSLGMGAENLVRQAAPADPLGWGYDDHGSIYGSPTLTARCHAHGYILSLPATSMHQECQHAGSSWAGRRPPFDGPMTDRRHLGVVCSRGIAMRRIVALTLIVLASAVLAALG